MPTRWRRSGLRHREHLADVFYLLLLALPFAALALLSLFALLGVLAFGGAVYVAGAVAAGARYVAKGRSERRSSTVSSNPNLC
jgi:uncharacterized RDD family membrane protein YckC